MPDIQEQNTTDTMTNKSTQIADKSFPSGGKIGVESMERGPGASNNGSGREDGEKRPSGEDAIESKELRRLPRAGRAGRGSGVGVVTVVDGSQRGAGWGLRAGDRPWK